MAPYPVMAKPTLAEAARSEPEPEATAPSPVMMEPALAEAARSEPQAEHPMPEPEPEPVVAANDAAPEPVIKPIIIGGAQDVVAEKKRGWWRR